MTTKHLECGGRRFLLIILDKKSPSEDVEDSRDTRELHMCTVGYYVQGSVFVPSDRKRIWDSPPFD